jgi:NTP pyrophosphatase (non-canonical NTP hydrolase)
VTPYVCGWWPGLIDIAKERERQERLKVEGRFKYTCADKTLTTGEKLAILTEELGEVAHAVKVRAALTTNRTDDADLRKELVQVAAIALAWVESLDREAGE